MTHRMIRFRWVVMVLWVVMCVALTAVAARYMYARIAASRTRDVIRLPRDYFVSNPESTVSAYFEPAASVTEAQDAEWFHNPVTYTYNADSLHERKDYVKGKQPGTLRMVTLGDSFTFGMFVDTKENFSERLEDLFNEKNPCTRNGYEVINLGVPGYDIEFSAERYRLRGAKYEPDIIAWYIQGNDFSERASFVRSQLPAIVLENERAGVKGTALGEAVQKKLGQRLREVYGSESEIYGYQSRLLSGFLGTVRDVRVMLLLDSHIEDRLAADIMGIASEYPNVSVFRLPQVSVLPDSHPDGEGHRQIAGFIYDAVTAKPETYCQDIRR